MQCLAVAVMKAAQAAASIGHPALYGRPLHQFLPPHHRARPNPLSLHFRSQHRQRPTTTINDKNVSNHRVILWANPAPLPTPSPSTSAIDIFECNHTYNLFDNNPFEYNLTTIKLNPHSPTFTPTTSYPTTYILAQTPQF